MGARGGGANTRIRKPGCTKLYSQSRPDPRPGKKIDDRGESQLAGVYRQSNKQQPSASPSPLWRSMRRATRNRPGGPARGAGQVKRNTHSYRVDRKCLMHLRRHASRSAIGVFLLCADVCLKTRRISISRCADKCYRTSPVKLQRH